MRILFSFLLLAAGLAAQPLERSTDSLERQNLLDRADQEVRSLRQEVEARAGASSANAPQYQAVIAAVQRAEAALAEYRISSETDRAATWQRFEDAKTQAQSLWQSSREPSPVTPAAP